MYLDKQRFITEMYQLRHAHDSNKYQGYAWWNELLQRTTSTYLWKNENMKEYMELLQQVTVLMVETIAYSKNFHNVTVDKYQQF